MEAVKEKPVVRAWVKPDRVLTDDEIEELIQTFDYESYEKEAYGNDDYEPAPIYDRFGNPTRDTIAALYESRHDIGDDMTLEEFFDEMRQLYEETRE